MGRDGGRGGGGGGVPHVASGVPGRAGDEEPATKTGSRECPEGSAAHPRPPGASLGRGTDSTEHSRMDDARGFLGRAAPCPVPSVKSLSEE